MKENYKELNKLTWHQEKGIKYGKTKKRVKLKEKEKENNVQTSFWLKTKKSVLCAAPEST